jgi:hypothetical protein
MKLTKLEQETIILANEEESLAQIETWNGRLKRKMEKLLTERPDEVTIKRAERDDSADVYYFPKKWIKINPPPIMSDEQREAARQRAIDRFGYNPS